MFGRSLKAGVIRQDLLEVKYPPAAFTFFFSSPWKTFAKEKGRGARSSSKPTFSVRLVIEELQEHVSSGFQIRSGPRFTVCFNVLRK